MSAAKGLALSSPPFGLLVAGLVRAGAVLGTPQLVGGVLLNRRLTR